MVNITPFEISDHLKSEEDMAAYFSAVWESGNVEAIIAALGDVAKARGMAKLTEATGLDQDTLNNAMRPGSQPRFDTIFRIMQGLNIRLEAVAG